MGRLIDATRLRTEVDMMLNDKVISPNTMVMMHRLIDEQPTTYDVEKVIEQTHKIFVDELDLVLKPLPDGAEYPEEAYRLLYLNDCVRDAVRNGGKE